MPADRTRLILGVSVVAGAMDALTGTLLLTTPATVLSLMGTTTPGGPAGEILVRYIGAFVTGVGLSYFWGLAVPATHGRRFRRMSGVWGATAIVRAVVALFCTGAVATGALAPAWLLVAATDGILAAVQGAALRAGWFES